MKGINQEIGNRIRDLRRQKGFTQEGLAYDCGLPQSQVAAIESGELNLTLDALVKVTVTLRVSLSVLLKGV